VKRFGIGVVIFFAGFIVIAIINYGGKAGWGGALLWIGFQRLSAALP
jgi:hypothetical protein